MSEFVHDQLLHIVERIERLEEETKALNDDKSEVYQEAKGNGFDVKVLKHVIRQRRKDSSEIAEFESLVDLYKHALGMLSGETGTSDATRARTNHSPRAVPPTAPTAPARRAAETSRAPIPESESHSNSTGDTRRPETETGGSRDSLHRGGPADDVTAYSIELTSELAGAADETAVSDVVPAFAAQGNVTDALGLMLEDMPANLVRALA